MRNTIIGTALVVIALSSNIAFAKYKVIDVTGGGTITGKVSFTGDDPAPKIFAVTKDNSVCGEVDRKIDFVKVNNGALTEAVVYLDKIKKGKEFPVIEKVSLQQKGCEFKPFISVMYNNSKIDAVNEDPVLHNIHTYEIIGRAKKTAFNVSQPDKGTVSKKIKFKRGSGMKVECDAHDFMHSFVFVAKNPYYAVVDKNGNYKIENVPPGKYKIKAWHGYLGEKKAKTEVSEGGSATVDFTYKK
jgi:hypothetical protein